LNQIENAYRLKLSTSSMFKISNCSELASYIMLCQSWA